MYNKLPLKFIGITDKYGLRKDPISGVSSFHYGTDFGWNKYQGEPIYAANTGRIVYEGYDSNLGNYIVLKYDSGDNTIINRYLHLKNRSLYKVNQKVERGQIIGYMGDTGYVTGVHLHFEYWVCPKNYVYKYSDRAKYAKDPLKYCYLFDDQEVSKNSSQFVKKVVGNPTFRDENKNQIKVILKGVNCRKQPSLNGEKLGYIDLGYYNILDTKINDGYIWYKIANNKWVAFLKNAVIKYSLKSTNNFTKNDDDDVKCWDNYKYFESNKDDYYYIFLKKGEKIYYPQ